MGGGPGHWLSRGRTEIKPLAACQRGPEGAAVVQMPLGTVLQRAYEFGDSTAAGVVLFCKDGCEDEKV